MKTFYISLTAGCVLALFCKPLAAQNVIATWALNSSGVGKTVAVTGTSSATVTAQPLTLGSALTDAGNSSSGQKLSISSGNWPSAVSSSNYADVTIAPAAGFDLSITSVSLDFAVTGGSGQLIASLQDSITGNSAFSPITASNTANLPTSSGSATTFPFTTSLDVSAGKSMSIRIYFYYSGSAVTSSRSVYLKNVILKGNTTSAVMPLSFSNFKASQQGNGIAINWSVASEVNISKYIIEKSADGISFSEAGFVEAKRSGSYSWHDVSVTGTDNFYRIKAVENTGRFLYTGMLKMNTGSNKPGIAVAPNPVKDNRLNLQLKSLAEGSYNAGIYNSAGQKIYNVIVAHTGGSASQLIQLPSVVGKGVYTLLLTGKNTSISKLIVIE